MAFTCFRSEPIDGGNRMAFEGIGATMHHHLAGVPGLQMVGIPMVLKFFVGIYPDGITERRTIHVSAPGLDDAETWTCDAELQHGQLFVTEFTLRFMVQRSGVNWFDVRVDDELLTRIPVRVEFPHD